MANITPEVQQDIINDAQAVYNLMVELRNAKIEKKQAVAALNENIKRIQAEIDEIINRHNETEETEAAS